MDQSRRVLGSGFGVSELAACDEPADVCVEKSFPGRYFKDEAAQEAFLRELSAWTALGRHPNLVCARSAAKAADGVRLVNEYIAPDELGMHTIDDHLRRRTPDDGLKLRWAIEICRGMEHAAAKGAKWHGDLRPANLFVAQDGTIKISDWGLARALAGIESLRGVVHRRADKAALSFAGPESFGAPTHMSPEQFERAASCDCRSDVYSFGVVLYEMFLGRPPFLAPLPSDGSAEEFRRYWDEMRGLHKQAVPNVPFTSFYPIITRCLEKDPARRFQAFSELRAQLEELSPAQAGQAAAAPSAAQAEAAEAVLRGFGLRSAGHFKAALACFDKAAELSPAGELVLRDKADCMVSLGNYKQALACCGKALEIDGRSAQALIVKGFALHGLNRPEESLACHEKALELDPKADNALLGKGIVLRRQNKLDAALACFEQAIELRPENARYYDEAGQVFVAMGLHKDAAEHFSKAAELDPQSGSSWTHMGAALNNLDRWEEALNHFTQAIELDGRDLAAWLGKSDSLNRLGRQREALESLDGVLSFAPQSAKAWFAKALIQKEAGDRKAAAACLQSFLALAEVSGGLEVEVAHEMMDGLSGVFPCGLTANSLPETSELVYNALDFFKDKRYAEALTCYQKASDNEPANAMLLTKKAEVLCAMAQYDAAKAACAQALQLAPRLGDALAIQGAIMARQNKPDAALALFDQALTAQPKLSRVWVDKARAEDAVGRRLEAIRSLERFLALAKEDQKDSVEEALSLLKEWHAR